MQNDHKDRTNPEYNPDWPNIQQDRSEELQALLNDLEIMIKDKNSNEDDLIRLNEEVDNARDAYLATYRMKHRTIDDFAQWIPRNLTMPGLPRSSYEDAFDTSFSSMEEASNLWRTLKTISKKILSVEEASLPVYPSDYEGPFSTTEYDARWEKFKLTDGNTISALVLTEDSSKFRFLFMQDPVETVQIKDHLTELANFVMQETTGDAGVTSSFSKAANRKRLSMFEFYLHVPPECGSDETFSKVKFRTSGGKYHSPELEPRCQIPHYVQKARFYHPKPFSHPEGYEPANDLI